MWGVVAGRGGVGCVCGVGMPLWLCLLGAVAGFPCFWRGVFLRVRAFLGLWVCCCVLPACPFARRGVPVRLFVCRLCPALSRVAGLLLFVLFVGYCVGVRFVSALARVCGVVHACLCGCAFDGDLGCRLLFTL